MPTDNRSRSLSDLRKRLGIDATKPTTTNMTRRALDEQTAEAARAEEARLAAERTQRTVDQTEEVLAARRVQHELVRVLGCTITVDGDMVARYSVDGHRVDAATLDRVLAIRKCPAEILGASLRAASTVPR